MGLSPAAWAGPKSGETFEIQKDLIGASGDGGRDSASGYRLESAWGLPFTGGALVGETGLGVQAGFWGGNAFRPRTGVNIVRFGDSRFPAKMTVGANAIPTDWIAFLSTSPATAPLAVSAAVVRAANDNLAKTLTRYTKPLDDRLWEIVVLDSSGKKYETILQSSATLDLPYADDNNDGLVDGANPPVRTKDLAVWWLDEVHSLWVKLPGATLNASDKTVSVPIRHFSVYAVMGAPSFNPGDVYAFPVPWRPFGPEAGSGAGASGTLSGGITFTNLPSEGTLRVYTLAGDLVRETAIPSGIAQLTWDVRNDAGEEVQTGTYVYVVESAGSRKTGKLAVIR